MLGDRPFFVLDQGRAAINRICLHLIKKMLREE
jgi:hypothetical protein